MQMAPEGKTIKIKMRGQDSEELQKQLQDFFSGANTDQEFDKRMNEFENMYTPKVKILQKSKNKFYGILDAYIQGTLTKEKALLLLQSKRQQLNEEIKDMAVKGCFIEIDYEDGNGFIPEEFMKIADEVCYYYNITKNNIGNADIKNLENFSNPAVKRVVKSIAASLDKYFGTAEKNGSQPEQETQLVEEVPPTQCNEKTMNSESPVTEPGAGINLPVNDVLENFIIQDNSVLRKWNNGKYKCKNLRIFVNRYADTTGDNPTKNLVLDYLVKEDGKPFKVSAIVSTLNTYGVAPERKKAKGRQHKGTHKKNIL